MYSLDGKENNGIRFLPLMRMYRYANKVYRVLRKVHLSSSLPCKEIWFGNWINILYEYETIILGETGNSYNVARYIKKKYPRKRVIIWFRNSISQTISPKRFDEKICEVWSFDKKDCEAYHLKYNPQFYIKIRDYKANQAIEYDAIFIGKDKGRLEYILKVEKLLNEQGLKTKFLIVGYNSEPIEYSKVLDYISQSKAIVDIQGEWQNGITLRPLEALLYEKKLISNCRDLIEMDFYSPSNIFILGSDDIDKVGDFVNNPYKHIDVHTVNQYGLDGWVSRFE